MTPTTSLDKPSIAYFSMEIALEPHVPTYSGGLGVLAGDSLRAAADLGLPIVGVTLVDRNGYFRQRLDRGGHQLEEADSCCPEERAELLDRATFVNIEGRRVLVRAWQYWIRGAGGHRVPVYLLDTCVPENSRGTNPSPITFMVAIGTTDSARKSFLASAALNFCDG